MAFKRKSKTEGKVHMGFKIELRKLYGGLNILKSNVVINNLNILSSRAEDGVNFVDSKIKINSINISNTFSDAIDSDSSLIYIDNLYCSNIGNDCLDLSFSKSKILNFNAINIADKAISLGESSVLNIKNSKVFKSEIGIVSKDFSKLYVENYSYEFVRLPITAFIKKREFGPPELIIQNIKSDSNLNYLISLDSNLTIGGKKFKSNVSSKEVLDKLYGNEFGVKTIRQ